MTLKTAELRPAEGGSTSLQSATNSIDTLLMDLDGTLYPIENGYEDHVRWAAAQASDNVFFALSNVLTRTCAMFHAVQTKHFQLHA